MKKFLNETWNEKNKHSVYTRCNECKTFGICFPQDDKCGNCGSDDTMQYWDAETISQELEAERRKGFEAGRKPLGPSDASFIAQTTYWDDFEEYKNSEEYGK